MTHELLGVPFTTQTKAEVLSTIQKWINSKNDSPKLVFTPNPEMLVLASENDEFKKVLNQSDLNIPDGWGVVRASKGKLKERISGSDLTNDLLDLANKHKWRVFLFGGLPGVASKARRKILDSRASIIIKAESGPASFETLATSYNDKIIRKINDFKPDLLFVGFGQMIQEKWLLENKNKLKVKVGLGVGGTIDYLAGTKKRAPKMVQSFHLEWLWRLLIQPTRIGRQLKLVKFMRLVR